jgi:N-acetylglutamate synthase-like GNAT family acetyltransferase
MNIDHLAEHPHLVPTLALWVKGEWGHQCPDVAYEKYVSDFQRQTTHGRIPETFVALEDNTLLGTASIIEHDMSTRMELSPWMASVYVAPEFRNKGVGSALVRTVMQEAGRLGLQKLYLITPDKGGFYSRLGWQVIETAAYRGENVTIMAYEVNT